MIVWEDGETASVVHRPEEIEIWDGTGENGKRLIVLSLRVQAVSEERASHETVPLPALEVALSPEDAGLIGQGLLDAARGSSH